MPFLPSVNAVQSPCQLHLAHPQQPGGAYVTQRHGDRAPQILEMAVDEADGHGALARGRSHPLH
jgi:hypothetical protein